MALIDSVSRAEMLETYADLYEAFDDNPYIRKELDKVYDQLNGLQSVEPERKWIPCSERLPEEETEVLVTRTFLGCKDGSHGWNNHIPPRIYVEVAQYFDGEWTALSDEYKVARSKHTDPIAWMPLPEPYRAERRADGSK